MGAAKGGDEGTPLLYFMATHLTTLSGENRHDTRDPQSQAASTVRLAQVRQILQITDELREAEDRESTPREQRTGRIPILLAGDFNARPGSPEMDELETAFVRVRPRWETSPSPHVWTHIGHRIHVDHVLYSDPDGVLEPRDCLVLDPGKVRDASDHLPVAAIFAS